mmetsp:Transcript_176545/g.560868  ORF Transcript_176545/g.560868 Transcript_176545/m.560868 type:complete len:229 (+) Transcript_176545:172-858(+)
MADTEAAISLMPQLPHSSKSLLRAAQSDRRAQSHACSHARSTGGRIERGPGRAEAGPASGLSSVTLLVELDEGTLSERHADRGCCRIRRRTGHWGVDPMHRRPLTEPHCTRGARRGSPSGVLSGAKRARDAQRRRRQGAAGHLERLGTLGLLLKRLVGSLLPLEPVGRQHVVVLVLRRALIAVRAPFIAPCRHRHPGEAPLFRHRGQPFGTSTKRWGSARGVWIGAAA